MPVSYLLLQIFVKFELLGFRSMFSSYPKGSLTTDGCWIIPPSKCRWNKTENGLRRVSGPIPSNLPSVKLIVQVERLAIRIAGCRASCCLFINVMCKNDDWNTGLKYPEKCPP